MQALQYFPFSRAPRFVVGQAAIEAPGRALERAPFALDLLTLSCRRTPVRCVEPSLEHGSGPDARQTNAPLPMGSDGAFEVRRETGVNRAAAVNDCLAVNP